MEKSGNNLETHELILIAVIILAAIGFIGVVANMIEMGTK